MSENPPNIKIRYMQVDEVGRVAELSRALQSYQNMQNIPRLPSEEDYMRELIHVRGGRLFPNNWGTFATVAVDIDRENEAGKSYIVGYMIFSQFFSIVHGRHLYMNSFFIVEEYRRNGLGKKFMEFLRTHGLITGNMHIDIPYMNDNVIGQKFYSKYGSQLVNSEYMVVGKQLDTNKTVPLD